MPRQDTETRGEFFKGLIVRHRSTVWRLCLRHAKGNAYAAEDLVQEVWMALWQYLDTLREGSTPGQERRWVELRTRALLHRLSLRERQRPGATGNLPEPAVEPEAFAGERMAHLLEVLGPDERQLVQMRLDGYSYAEIGAAVGKASLTVRVQMSRIMYRLRAMADRLEE